MPEPHPAIAADLENLVARVQKILRELESLDMAKWGSPLDGEEADEQDAEIERETRRDEEVLAEALTELGQRLLVYAEALALPSVFQRVTGWFARWTDTLSKTRVWANEDDDGRESPAFNDLSPTIEALLVLLRPDAPPPDPIARRDHERLEYCLRSLAKVCRERSVVPSREADVQGVLHSHLEGVFPDYSRTVVVAKPLLSFRPDGGVVGLRAAIECKFVGSESEVAIATHGLTEDLSGYAGSDDWRTFYSVIYMTGAFATEGQFIRALGASGHAGTWKLYSSLVRGVANNARARARPSVRRPTPVCSRRGAR